MNVPEGVWSPIMCLPMLFEGEEGGTREAYDLGLGRESLSGSPSSKTMWRRSECARLVERAGDDGGVGVLVVSLEEGEMLGIPRVSICESALAPTSSV